MTSNEIIVKLVEHIISQDKELETLRKRLERIDQYITVYEDYIKRG